MEGVVNSSTQTDATDRWQKIGKVVNKKYYGGR
jgi:hypothetical protein